MDTVWSVYSNLGFCVVKSYTPIFFYMQSCHGNFINHTFTLHSNLFCFSFSPLTTVQYLNFAVELVHLLSRCGRHAAERWAGKSPSVPSEAPASRSSSSAAHCACLPPGIMRHMELSHSAEASCQVSFTAYGFLSHDVSWASAFIMGWTSANRPVERGTPCCPRTVPVTSWPFPAPALPEGCTTKPVRITHTCCTIQHVQNTIKFKIFLWMGNRKSMIIKLICSSSCSNKWF